MYRIHDRFPVNGSVPAMDAKLCVKEHVLLCNIPDVARKTLPVETRVQLCDRFHVRGINSSFCEVKTSDGKRFFVHEDLLVACG